MVVFFHEAYEVSGASRGLSLFNNEAATNLQLKLLTCCRNFLYGVMMKSKYFGLLLFCLLFAHLVQGQTATISGQIFDSADAAIPGATVTATSAAIAISRTVTTTSAGLYNITALPPGVYNVRVTASGFETSNRTNVTLNVSANVPLNFTLAIGSATTSIDVDGTINAPIETDSFELSSVVDSRQITNLPLILRDPYQLVLLSPGAVTATNNDSGFAINGQRDRNNNFLLDGVDNNDTSVPGIPGGISSANPASTQEFRVITNNFDAEYGRNTGAIVDVITRSGTNRFHGDAYEFGRYNAVGARDFFNTKENGPQDPYVRNNFGASVGGPVWKDRTFFFLNGDVQRFRTTRTASTTTPTAAFRTGRFTYFDPTDNGAPTSVDLTHPGNPDNLSGRGIDPTLAKIYAIAPVGQSDNGDGVTSTYFFASPDALNSYTLTGRLDHKLTEKHQLTVRYIYGHTNDNDFFHDEVLPGYGNTASIATNHNGIISVASVITPNSTNIFRSGFNMANAGYFCNHARLDALLGVDSFGNGRDIDIPGFFGDRAFGCTSLGESNQQARLTSTLTFSDTFALTKGKHSIKFGGEFRSIKSNNSANFSSRNLLGLSVWSDFNADAYNFQNTDSPSYPSFENLIWGAQGVVAETSEAQFFTRSGLRRGSDYSRFRQHEWAIFTQDTWKATPHLTLIGGIRYAFNGVPYEKDANFSNFYGDASAVTPANGFVFTPVGPGTGRQLYADSWRMIEPRIGFTYDVSGNGKTAIRGGYGIFHDRLFDNLFGNARSNPPLQATFNDFPFDPGSPRTSPTVSTTAFPAGLTPSAVIFDGAFLTPVVIDPHLQMPTNQAYNLGIQHQLNGRLSLELNYVGSHTTHALREIDGAPPQPALVQQLIASGVPASQLQQSALYTTFHATNNTAFFSEYFQTSIVSGNYNAIQLSVRGQLSALTINASYSLAHALDNGSDPLTPGAGNTGLPYNSFDLGPEYGNADTDVRHRVTIAAIYDLPIGDGKGHLHHGLLGRLFEGMALSGIQQAQTGLPFDLRGTRDNLHTSWLNRPALTGKPYPSRRGTITATGVITGPAQSAFANPAFDQNVSIHRNKFYGPSFVNTDVVFQKTQTLHNEAKLVVRAESYNVLNHPNFYAPPSSNLSIASSTFGVSDSQVGQNDGTTGARQIQGAIKIVF